MGRNNHHFINLILIFLTKKYSFSIKKKYSYFFFSNNLLFKNLYVNNLTIEGQK